jgi:hypothetical protein
MLTYPIRLIKLAKINGLKLPNSEIILLTNGDKAKNMIVNGSNTKEDAKVVPPKPIGIGALTSMGIVWQIINMVKPMIKKIINNGKIAPFEMKFKSIIGLVDFLSTLDI